MKRNLVLALVKCWMSRSKAFRLANQLVSFSVFDVVSITSLPAIAERVEFNDGTLSTEFGDIVREGAHEEEEEDLR